MRFVVEVITIGSGLLDFLGASFSGRVFSALVVSVSMSFVFRGSELSLLWLAACRQRIFGVI
jgi:hypothetical protein